MSTINTAEIASLYGALDSDAFADGGPFSAHLLRAMVMSANRLASKGEQIICLPWPIRSNVGEDTIDGMRAVAPLYWTRIYSPIPCPKRPGLNRADVRIRARVSDTDPVWVQVATRARPFNAHAASDADNVIVITPDGDNDIDQYTKDSIPIDPGPYEEIEIYIKGEPTGNGPSTGGSPTARGGLGSAPTYGNNSVEHASATWTAALAEDGHYIEFYDDNGNNVIFRGVITSVNNAGTRLYYTPAVDMATLFEIADADDWSIYQLPTFEMTCFSMACRSRSS